MQRVIQIRVLHIHHPTHNFLTRHVFYILLEDSTISSLQKFPYLWPQTTGVPETVWFSLWQQPALCHQTLGRQRNWLKASMCVLERHQDKSLGFNTAGDPTVILGNSSPCGLKRTGVLHAGSYPWRYRDRALSMPMCTPLREGPGPDSPSLHNGLHLPTPCPCRAQPLLHSPPNTAALPLLHPHGSRCLPLLLCSCDKNSWMGRMPPT